MAQTTAFVLAGGGSFGAIQVGMLKALTAAGVKADMIVGSSVGAINAAYFAGNPTSDGARALDLVWRRLKRNEVFPVTWRALIGFALRRDFLVSAEGVRRLADQYLTYRNIEDARLPLHIVATDILSGEPVVLSRGRAVDALLASSAIPAAFAPVAIDGRHLADGAITSNTPVRVAVGLGATRLIVLPTGFACARQDPPAGALANALHALTLLIARQLVAELDGLPPSIDYAIVPSLCPLDGSPYDFSRVGNMIDTAEAAATRWIEGGGLHSRVVPDELRAHSHRHAM